MAWQSPKLDWAPEDGLLNTDMNRIEGNVEYLHDNIEVAISSILKESLHLHVSPTGSDTTGDGTQAKPFATIGKALSLVPPNLNNNNAVVYLAAGTYNEPISISNKSNGGVVIAGVDRAAAVLNGDFSARECTSVSISDFSSLTINGHMYLDTVQAMCCQADDLVIVDSTYGSAIDARASNLSVSSRVRVKSVSYGSGVLASVNSRVFCDSITVDSGTGTGIYADYGGQVAYGTITNNATTGVRTSNGGRVYYGAQTSVPNY